ncbi:MAG: Acetyltransferase [Rickettsia helvetica]|uniref:Acetyltransferase n=1 Tax=Rickettsia helvetica TaxID=35789 RepID=A0ABM9ND57_RICHE
MDQSLIETFRYLGLQEQQIDGINYYLIHIGCNHPVWNMIVLPDKVNISQMDKMEEVFKL